MLKKLKAIFSAADVPEDDSESKIRVSLAALLIEMARADFDQTDKENAQISALLAAHFTISKAEALELLDEAQIATNDAVSLHDFVRALHTTLTARERLKVIELLWQVALADNRLDKYEDHLVKKIADLMYVPASDVLRLKHAVIGD
jgi:uncharacterized tellurite resistance protein B-like protein